MNNPAYAVQRSTISEFSYIEDVDGYIYIARGMEIAKGQIVCLVYLPADNGTKTNLDGRRYKKRIFETGRNYLADLNVEEATKVKLDSMLITNPDSHEEYLVLETHNISRIFDPNSSRETVLTDAAFSYARTHVQNAIKICESAQIQHQDIGIYGGTQALLKNEGRLNDVDLVCRGLRYYSNIQAVVAEHGIFVDDDTDLSQYDEYSAALTKHRMLLSCINIGDNIGCDLRIQRNDTDIHTYAEVMKHFYSYTPTVIELSDAVVVDAQESLSMCPTYKVRMQDGPTYWVSSIYYNFIAVAKVGDSVKIRGQKLSDNQILICSPYPEIEYIQPQLDSFAADN